MIRRDENFSKFFKIFQNFSKLFQNFWNMFQNSWNIFKIINFESIFEISFPLFLSTPKSGWWEEMTSFKINLNKEFQIIWNYCFKFIWIIFKFFKTSYHTTSKQIISNYFISSYNILLGVSTFECITPKNGW